MNLKERKENLKRLFRAKGSINHLCQQCTDLVKEDIDFADVMIEDLPMQSLGQMCDKCFCADCVGFVKYRVKGIYLDPIEQLKYMDAKFNEG